MFLGIFREKELLYLTRFMLKDVRRNVISVRAVHHVNVAANTQLEKVVKMCKAFIAPIHNETHMKNIMKVFKNQLEMSCLSDKTHLTPLVTKNTFIQEFASGKEKGQYLSLLIGIDNLEIMKVSIHPDLVRKLDKKTHKFSNFQKQNFTTDMLIAFAVEFVIEYITEDLPRSEQLLVGVNAPLVITYELPQWLDQKSIDRGIILTTNEGKPLAPAYRYEIQELFRSMFAYWGYTFQIKCILSYGCSSFHDKQWLLRECIASIVLDHGVTLCHLEKTKDVTKFHKELDLSKEYVLLSTDISEFGNNHELDSIKTEFDLQLDTISSKNPGKKSFKKLVSETYLGELFRLIVIKLIKEYGLLHSEVSNKIKRPYSITSSDVGLLENWIAKDMKYENILRNKMGYSYYGLTDMMALSFVADVVMERATRVIALVLATLAETAPDKSVGFIYLGNLVIQHRLLRNRINEYVRFYCRHLDKRLRVVKASSDSALRGAALMASRIN